MKWLLIFLCAQVSFCQTVPKKQRHKTAHKVHHSNKIQVSKEDDAAMDAIIQSLKTNNYQENYE